MFYYCPQCGFISSSITSSCPACDHSLCPVPATYLSASGNMFSSQNSRKEFIQKVIEAGVAYRPELAEKCEDILAEKKKARTEVVV